MSLLLADTFTASLARLTDNEQKVVKTTAFDLQMNPASPGMRFHKLERASDRNFWSVRVSSDIRIIVHKTDDSVLLCYVDHHDAAYAWAERRKIEVHPSTGAAQLVEIRETVKEVIVPVYRPAPTRAPHRRPLFDAWSDDDLLGFGVPSEWLTDVRASDEDSILTLVTHLPAEAAEALLEAATGGIRQAGVRRLPQSRLDKSRQPSRSACHTQTRSGASASWLPPKTFSAHSTRHGTSGPSSCIRSRSRS